MLRIGAAKFCGLLRTAEGMLTTVVATHTVTRHFLGFLVMVAPAAALRAAQVTNLCTPEVLGLWVLSRDSDPRGTVGHPLVYAKHRREVELRPATCPRRQPTKCRRTHRVLACGISRRDFDAEPTRQMFAFVPSLPCRRRRRASRVLMAGTAALSARGVWGATPLRHAPLWAFLDRRARAPVPL